MQIYIKLFDYIYLLLVAGYKIVNRKSKFTPRPLVPQNLMV